MIIIKKVNIILIIIITLLVHNYNCIYADDYNDEEEVLDIYENEYYMDAVEAVVTVNASAAIVMDYLTGRVLFEKNSLKEMPMASTTKIMTAIVALENGKLEDNVTISKKAAGVRGSSFHIKAGEEYTLNELMYGLLLSSGNDAAVAVAEHIGGSLEGFLDMMNEKAWLIGARNSHFKSPHGLDISGHYTTAYDLALITRYALSNPVLSKFVSTKTAVIKGRELRNTNEMLSVYSGADGVKTGYTGQAGRCLVTSATRDGRRFISVVLGCPTKNHRTISSKKLLDYTFNTYTYQNILSHSKYIADIKVQKGKTQSVSVRSIEDIVLPLSSEELQNVKTHVTLVEAFDAPIYAGVDAGAISFYLDDKLLAQSKLKTWYDVYRKDYFDYFREMIDKFLLIFQQDINNVL